MKKILLSVVCLVMVGMQSVNAQVGIVALHHEGHVTVFGEDKIASAIEAAVAGDTIYMSEGHFLGDVTINKAIHLIGSGQGTTINGNVNIDIENNPTVTGYMLAALNINGDVKPKKSIDGLRISQCKFKSFYPENEITLKNFFMDRSYVTSDFLTISLDGGTVNNCKIGSIQEIAPIARSYFYHCNYGYYSTNSGTPIGIMAINCIINQMDGQSHNVYQNCLFNFLNDGYPENGENCWGHDPVNSTTNIFDDDCNCVLSDQELQANGYIGTDNTVVGITGGDAPYTLKLITPRVLEHNIVVDKENKKVNVTLTVGTE